MTAEMTEVPITELEKIDAERVDGVSTPASGIPILLMKAAGPASETQAAQSAAPQPGPAETAARAVEEFVWKRSISADERRQLAADGKALPDGSYPIASVNDLKSAAVLAQSGHGDADAAKKLIARRAKELGVVNPLDDNDDDDTSKNTLEPESPTGDNITKDSLAKAVADAVTKAIKPLQDDMGVVKADLAKVKAQPASGGPLMSLTRANLRSEKNEDEVAKAAYYRGLADTIADPATAAGYRQLARQAEDKAKAPAVTS